MSKKVRTYRLDYNDYVIYNVPSKDEALANINETYGTQYDPIEKKEISGGIPQLWKRD